MYNKNHEKICLDEKHKQHTATELVNSESFAKQLQKFSEPVHVSGH